MKIMHGDCLDILKSLPDNSVDCILTDPPYGTLSLKWDSVIDFDKMWLELKRVRKPRAAVVLFGSEPFSSALRMSNISEFKYDWIWMKSKTVGYLNAKNAPLKCHENISVFSDGTTANKSINRMVYFPQCEREILKEMKSVSGKTGSAVGSRPSRTVNYISTHEGYPRSILTYKSEYKPKHATQKPVDLLEYLIKTYTIEGDTVLDFTCGSGSTGIACLNTGRHFIGIEKDAEYFQIAKNRIAEAQRAFDEAAK